jgi:rare lipoprotein A
MLIHHPAMRSRRLAHAALGIALAGALAGCAGSPTISPGRFSQAPSNGEGGCYAPPPNLNAAYNRPYRIRGQRYYPAGSASGYDVRGVASWYGWESGSTTSMGTPFRPRAYTAASRTLPLPTCARVTNLSNGRSVVVLVNDRGPFVDSRVMDLSYGAANALGIVDQGTAPVQIVALNGSGVPMQGQAPSPAPRVAPSAPAPRPMPSIPSAAPPTGAQAPELRTPAENFLQTGAFAVLNNAIRERDRLQAAGIHGVLIVPGYVRDQEYYKVQIGPLPAGVAPGALMEQLQRMGFSGFYMVRQ